MASLFRRSEYPHLTSSRDLALTEGSTTRSGTRAAVGSASAIGRFPPAAPAGAAVAGLYVPSFHPGHAEHDLTQKIRRSKTSREHDLEFAELLAATLARRLPGLWPELVVSVPPRPGEGDRFGRIRAELAARIGAADAGRALCQLRVVEGYRQMTTPQRIAACAARFAAQPGSVASLCC